MTGKLQNEQGVIHVVADRMEDLTPMLGLLSEAGATIDPSARADEVKRPQMSVAQKRQGNRFAAPPRLDDPRAPPTLPLETAEVRKAMPARAEFPVSRSYGLAASGWETSARSRVTSLRSSI